MRAAWLVSLVGCGADPAALPDAELPSTVTLLAPNGGELLEPAEETSVRWAALAADATVTLELVDAAGQASPIATLQTTAGEAGELAWTPIGVPAPTRYKVRISLADGASDESDGFLTISPPATGVSLAADLGPLFDAKCNTPLCHSTATQASVLDLTLGKAHPHLVGVKSRHTACAAFDRVAPGSPATSFLIFKLQGSGACFAGVRMPKGSPALTAAELQLIRDWISEGAKNN